MTKLDARTQKDFKENSKLKTFEYIDTQRRYLIIWFVDIMRQTLKSKQRKQI